MNKRGDIHFFYEEVDFCLPVPAQCCVQLEKMVAQESKQIDWLNFIFCNKSYLYALNEEHLGHLTDTDIITFNHTEGD